MIITRIFCIIILGVLFNSCTTNDKFNPVYYPSDYLFAQRSYPYGTVDKKAYGEALSWKEKLAIDHLKYSEDWQSLGPINFNGRITDIELHPGDDQLVYAGSASGGIYKSENGGTNWFPIFDEARSLSIGDLAISTNNPDIIYAGTGESNAGGGSIAYDGTGVYKSVNGGVLWQSIGLEDVGSIGKIAISPENDSVVFVAAMGELFKNNSERGVYRTKDRGSSWEQILFVSDSTGAIDLAIHPQNGNIIYAAMWERIRRPYNRQYGGESSGIYLSEDGGNSWIELTNGLPTNPSAKGRIGLAISESDPNILYAYYAKKDGSLEGIFKTENGGKLWTRMSIEGINSVSFMWWFGKIFVDYKNPNKVYATSLNMFASSDGAESWNQIFPFVHVDHHALAFSRQDSSILFNGNDGGVYFSNSLGNAPISYMNGMSNIQFYTCTIDPTDANVVYGGAQDNGTFRMIDKSGTAEKIFGGDGFRVMVDPNNPQQIYYEAQNGSIYGSSNGGDNSYFAAAFIQGTFNWNAPLAMDPFNTSTIYTGTQKLYKSVDMGRNWAAISISLVNSNNPIGIIPFGTLSYIETSVLDAEVIYVGTDDGNVWVTKDGGNSFINISANLPNRWVTSIEVDPWNESGVYVAFSGFRFGESESQIFYSNDYGESWESKAGNLPDIPVNDIIADDKIIGQLYVATDIGVYGSDDQGLNWDAIASELPNVPILDIDIHSEARWLVAASYGRGMYGVQLPTISSNESLVQEEIQVYPNPASEFVFIESKSEIEQLIMFDLQGRVVKNKFKDNRIEVSDLISGIYFIQIKSKTGISLVKCLIN